MLLAHAIAIAEARSYIAALDDYANTTLGAIAYDRALIYLDTTHGDQVPALDAVPVEDPELLYQLAGKAVADLAAHGLDPLHVELTLAYLADAWALDNEQPAPPRAVEPGES